MSPARMDLPGPNAQRLLERDAHVVSPSYPRDYPFVIERGRGTRVWDVDGHRFLDFAAGIAVCTTGHSHPDVVRAVQQQAEKFLHISSDFWHEGFTTLLETLSEIAPFRGGAKTFICNSGTEAVETAIKLARHHTNRPRFIGFHGGFHGRTLGSLSFTASKPTQRQGFFPGMPGVTHVPFPDPYRPRLAVRADGEGLGAATVRYIEELIFKTECPPEDVAAFLIEPLQGEGGYVVPPDDFFPLLRGLCDRHGILLIVDEVQCGMGRTGRMWAIQEWNVEPDIVCSAKGIASGLPLGATIAKPHVMSWKPGAHGNTYGGNPLACAAANVTIGLLRAGLVENASRQGSRLLQGLRGLQAKHPSIGEVRGRGLFIGVEFVRDRQTREPDARLRDRMVSEAFHHGLLLLGCGRSVVRITPPLTVSDAECDEALAILDHVIGLAEAAA
ncbi:MAG: acetyl ornithine aminotransferase family protein [Acidobacteriota bacterium]